MIRAGRIPYDPVPPGCAVPVSNGLIALACWQNRTQARSFTRSTMILLTASDLSRQFDADPVFRGVSLEVHDGEKIGLVGPNGCGKTTLLNILAGRDEPDVGVIERHPSASVGMLEQEIAFASGRTLREEVQSGLEHLYSLQRRAHAVAEQIATTEDEAHREKLQRQYDDLHQALDRLDAYHVEHRVDEVLHGLGFEESDYERDLNTFSGGQQNRAILGRLLLASPDVMLLDEPTNHLDIATTEWLEGFLIRSRQAVIVVSHDRYFLDRVTQRTVEIYRGGVNEYTGNFSAYWRQRKERHELQQRTYEKQQEFIARTEDFIRRNAYGQKHAQAKDREKKLERLERVAPPPGIDEPPITFPKPTRTGDWVLRCEGLSKSFSGNGDENGPLFDDLHLQVDRGDRLAIFGPNGSGKTTLVRILTGELSPDTGQVRQGTGVRIAYFDQQLTSIDPELSAVDAVRPVHDPSVTPGELRKLLARFGVRGDLALQTVGAMSGGEKTRVALAKLASAEPNVLILDEPTNHLDFWSAAALEQALGDYPGTAIVVSHDRFFLDRVATKMLVLEHGGWRLFEGNYSDYLHLSKVTGEPAAATASEKSRSTQTTARRGSTQEKEDAPKRRRRFPYRKVHDIEEDIASLEARIAELQTQMADPDVLRNGETIRQVTSEHKQAEEELAKLVEHWEEALELN